MRKAIAKLMVIILSLSLLAGCGSETKNSTAASEPPTTAIAEKPTGAEPTGVPSAATDTAASAPTESLDGANHKNEPSDEPSSPSGGSGLGLSPSLDDFPLAFGFAGMDGDRLLIQCYEGGETEDDPEQYTLAIGPYGITARISYSGWQDESGENNYRDTAENFDNLPGYVFQAVDSRLLTGETYCLTTTGVLDSALVPLVSPARDPDGFFINPGLDVDVTDRIAALKSRGVVWASQLALTEEGAGIALVLFEREGDDMLFSIVYIEDDKTVFWDCPAVYDEMSTWRVDMGDDPGELAPLFLARLENGLVLVLTWGAPEGEGIVVLYEDGGEFVDRYDYGYSRYWSPW